MEQDQQFVQFVLQNVVDNPDDVVVERTIDEMGVLISVTVNPTDMGKVIGKSGQTAKAIRTLLKVVGAKHDARVNMKIIEPEGSTHAAAAPAPGTTDDVDDAAVTAISPADDPQVVNEVVQEQANSEAATELPNENDEIVDEATGETVDPGDPTDAQEKPGKQKDAVLHERSPLDDL